MVLSTEHKQLCVQGFIRVGGGTLGKPSKGPLPNLVTCFENWYKYDVQEVTEHIRSRGCADD